MPVNTSRKDSFITAVVQCESIDSDPVQALEKMDKICANTQCDLIIFPEMYLSGYNITAQSLQELAAPANGYYAEKVSSLAQKYHLNIIFGYPEKADNAVYNSAQLISYTGEIKLNYRKTHLFGEYDHSCFTSGTSDSGIATVAGWNIGIQICYDIEFPENARILALMGADIIAVPTANMLPFQTVAQILLPARALENQLYIAYANYCGQARDLTFCGHSTIVAPDGKIIAQDQGYTSTDANIIYGHCDGSRLHELRTQYSYLEDRIPKLYDKLVR